MSKKTNIAAILAATDTHTKAELNKLNAAQVEAVFKALPQEADTHVEDDDQHGSKVPQKYRKAYAELAASQGRKAHTYTGRATLNNGDELALLLESASPEETCALNDVLTEQEAGTTQALYTADRIGRTHPKTGAALKALNPGMVRMNAGNRVRAHIKAGKHSVKQVSQQLKALIAQRPPVEAPAA